MTVVCACCAREPDEACRDYHCPHYGPKAAVAATGLPSLIDRLIPPKPDIRLVLQDFPHALPGGLIGNTVEQGPPYNLYEPRARIAEAMIKPDGGDWDVMGLDERDLDTGEHRLIRVFEFGALLGYGIGAVAHRLGAHRVVAGWVDDESHTPGSNDTCAENLRSIGLDCWWETNRREALGFERADVVLVDGDHSYAGTMDDLAYAYRLRPRLIFVDDHIPEHAGVVDAVRSIREAKVRVPTVNGLVVVAMREGASVWGLGALVESCGLEWEEIR